MESHAGYGYGLPNGLLFLHQSSVKDFRSMFIFMQMTGHIFPHVHIHNVLKNKNKIHRKIKAFLTLMLKINSTVAKITHFVNSNNRKHS